MTNLYLIRTLHPSPRSRKKTPPPLDLGDYSRAVWTALFLVYKQHGVSASAPAGGAEATR